MTEIKSESFGSTSDGLNINKFILRNSNGVKVHIINYGAIITDIEVPDKNGSFVDVACGYDNIKDYEDNPAYLGAMVGRVCNRIEDAEFELDGQKFNLARNMGSHCIHGGVKGWSKAYWDAVIDNDKLVLTYLSKDGEENFPGNVQARVIYSLTNDNGLVIDMHATTDKPTIVSLTNHSYFNLAGHDSGEVYDHMITINADKCTPKTPTGVSTGEIDYVSGVYDLRKPARLGDRIPDCLASDMGYDLNYCINKSNLQTCCAKLECPKSGIVLEVFTDQPGVHLYTSNFFDGYKGKNGATYNKHGAVALETQSFPNAIKKKNFPSVVLRPGEVYQQTCIYKFSVAK